MRVFFLFIFLSSSLFAQNSLSEPRYLRPEDGDPKFGIYQNNRLFTP